MVDPTIDNRVIRSLSASTREKSPRKKRKKKNNPVDIVFTRMPKTDFKPKRLKTRSQVDIIRKTAGNIEKASRPKSERKLPASGKLGPGTHGGEHKQAFVKAAIRDQLRRGDLDFGRKKGQHLGAPLKPKSELGEHGVNVRTMAKYKTRELRKGDESRVQNEYLRMGRVDTKADESLSMHYDKTKVDDVLGQFKTGTGKKPKDKRRRKIKVYTTDPHSGRY